MIRLYKYIIILILITMNAGLIIIDRMHPVVYFYSIILIIAIYILNEFQKLNDTKENVS